MENKTRKDLENGICPICETKTISEDISGYSCCMCDEEWNKTKIKGLIMPQ